MNARNGWMLVWVAVAGVLYTAGAQLGVPELEVLAGVVVGGALWPSRGPDLHP